MLRLQLQNLLVHAVETLVSRDHLPKAVLELPPEVTEPRSAGHGDFACNFALAAAKLAGLAPRAIGELLREELASQSDFFEKVELAGPGFLNMTLRPTAVAACVPRVVSGQLLQGFGSPLGVSTNVEFVSVNPNGPITIGSGRGAAFGDALCRVLHAAGANPYREYYINDGVNSRQMRLFAQSVKFHYRSCTGLPAEPGGFPDEGYKGAYVEEVAKQLAEQFGNGWGEAPVGWFQERAEELMIERQREDLESFRVRFDHWQSEQLLHEAGKVDAALELLEGRGNAYRAVRSLSEGAQDEKGTDDDEEPVETEGEALWLRSTAFGDDKDRVLVRADGRPAYLAADVAYLADKFGRGFTRLKLILGPDHHGYIQRMYAACEALGHTTGRDGEFEIIIYQAVRFVKNGQAARMRKRDGNIYELRDLIDELGADAAPTASDQERLRTGADVARFFFLMRSHDTHMDFDIDLATKQSDENPVFYAQYAHARICSVLAKAREAGFPSDRPANCDLLDHPKEIELIKKIVDLPFEVERSAKDYGVHRLATFSIELARGFHHFYDACRVLQPSEPELTSARVSLCEAARIGLAATFELLGVSAPERMDRQRGAEPAPN